MDDHQI